MDGPATQARINNLVAIAVGADGSVYIVDKNVVRRVDPSGVINTVAGNGTQGFPSMAIGDGGPATQASMGPRDVAVAADGSLYIADSANSRVRKVSPSGIITTVAGNGRQGIDGDGGPAVAASLITPDAVTLGQDGSIYIRDYTRVRRVDPTGTITTVAGNGGFLFNGDGLPAVQ
jgi:serine/threonine-protein kinase